MTPDVIALRAHLVAEGRHAQKQARRCQRRSLEQHDIAERASHRDYADGGVWATTRQHWANEYATTARTATDAWLAADARLRALDGLLEASGVAVRP